MLRALTFILHRCTLRDVSTFFYCKFMEQTAKFFNTVVMECNDSAKLNALPPQKVTGSLCLSRICEYTQTHHTIFAQDAI